MAFYAAAVCRAASSAVILARAAGRNRRIHHSAVALIRRPTPDGLVLRSTVGSTCRFRFSRQITKFSTAVVEKKPEIDSELIEVIKSEIECAEDCEDLDRVEDVPEEFPFEIQDEEGTSTITLKRTFGEEKIEVIVSMPSLVTEEFDEDDDEQETAAQDDNENSNQSSIPMTICIDKGKGSSLVFMCTAYADDIAIDGVSVKENKEADQDTVAYEGPDIENLDENLQKAFHRYLEMRGITTVTANFLHEYMIKKDSREYLLWLQNLKEFVEK